MGNGSSSNSNESDNNEDVRNRLNSGDFHKISPPHSPNIEEKQDEMAYSGILVEKPESETTATAPSMSVGATFAADLTSPSVSSGRRKIVTKPAAPKEQPRRIVKATPPQKVVVDVDDNRNDKDSESPAVTHHSSTLASPIGANAASEMLEESIEKNDSKNKRMERVTSQQKSKREKLLQEKRRQTPGSDKKPQVEANPFSRFLPSFIVSSNPTHKRKESADSGDSNKRLKFGFNNSATVDSPKEDTTTPDGEVPDFEEKPLLTIAPWMAAAGAATVALLVLALVRGGKKK